MKLVIFDLDGTVVDTVSDLAIAVNYALSTKNLATHNEEEYRLMVGNGVSKLVERAMPEHLREDSKLHAELLDCFIDYYKAHIVDNSKLYPGIYQIVLSLKENGYKLAIASNKFQEGTTKIVNHFFPANTFDVVFGVKEGFPLKPDPKVIYQIIEKVGANLKDTILVGDSGTDMKTAQNAGIMGIGVSWGFRPEDAKSLATLFVDSPEKLLTFFKNNKY